MVSTVQHDATPDTTPGTTDTVARPDWPQHARTDGDVVDLREDHDLRGDRALPYADATPVAPRRGLRARRVLGWILAAAALAVVAVVAVVNRDLEVGIDLAVDDGTLPLWSIIVGASALGFAAGRFLDDGS
jgi:hypothetical protein